MLPLRQKIEEDYLSYWLQKFVASGMVTSEHLMYQEIDAFLTEQLCQPYHVHNWQKWPTLYSFCQSLASVATRKGYNFYVGAKRFGLKEQKTVVAPVIQYCHPGPSLKTLDGKKNKPSAQSGPHLANIALILKIIQSVDGIPCYKDGNVIKFFGIVHYDGMPLNIGTFPRIEDKNVIFDGIKPHITLQRMVELQRDGTGTVNKYIAENCKWTSEIKEYDITDASGPFYINAYSIYGTAQGTSHEVRGELSDVIASLEVCSNCIQHSKQTECTFKTLKGPCDQCKVLQDCGQEICCTSFKVVHVSSDQAPSQRKAHEELNKVSSKDINEVDYIQYGFGLLHFCKNCLSSARNYRLTNMSETFSVVMLTAIWVSKSEESNKMRKIAPSAVFTSRDRHSDEICYQTVSKDMEDIVRETGSVLLTLVPEQYKTYKVEAKTHSLLGRPLYITTNANGDFIWTGKLTRRHTGVNWVVYMRTPAA
jgi:hypothetical protein